METSQHVGGGRSGLHPSMIHVKHGLHWRLNCHVFAYPGNASKMFSINDLVFGFFRLPWIVFHSIFSPRICSPSATASTSILIPEG